ncbi:MAG TPA: AAA family ATPase [Acidimicrobiales bacterium]|nr:AAA family ATPase [Acidimicrobiales bacterium]
MPEDLADRYELLAPVASGGHGEVWKAVDRRDGSVVAVKRGLGGADRDGHDGLAAEAALLARLPAAAGLPSVRGRVRDGDHDALVMEWVDGVDLAAACARPGVGPTEIADWLVQIGEALDHLHAQWPPVVHADVKPANCLITAEGRAVLVDFGLARPAGAGLARAGTCGYRAPEVAAGATPTPAADVYGLAATAAELLLGGRPAAAGPLEAQLRRGLATDPDDRPLGAGAFARRVEEILAEPPDQGPGGPGSTGRPVLPWLAELDPQGFVGRRPVRRELMRRLGEEGPRLLVLRGEAGIGKSALATAVAARAAAAGWRVLFASCHRLPSVGSEPVQEILRQARAWPGGGARPTGVEMGVEMGAQAADEVRRAVLAVVAELAADAPVLIVVDDLHWADQALLALGQALLGPGGPGRVRLLVTVRPAELAARPDVTRFLAGAGAGPGAGAGAGAIDLGGLDRSEMAELAFAHDDRFDPAELDAVSRASGGNPLLLIHLLALRPGYRGPGPMPDQAPPPALAVLVAERVRRLPAATQRALGPASLLGSDVDLAVLDLVVGCDSRPALEAAVVDGLLRAGRQPGRLHFVHGLVQEAVEASVPVARRRRLHASVARAVQMLHGATRPDLVARHLLAAVPEVDGTEAVARATEAAAWAAERLATETAIGLLRRSLDLTGEESPLRAGLWAQLGEAYFLAGRHELGRDALRHALAAPSGGGPVGRATLHRRLSFGYEAQRRWEEAFAELGRAEAVLGTPPARGPAATRWWAERLEVTTSRVRLHYWTGEPGGLEELRRQAEAATSRAAVTPSARADLELGLIMLELRSDRFLPSARTVAVVRSYLDRIERDGPGPQLVQGHFIYGFTLLLHGAVDQAVHHLRLACGLAAGREDPTLQCRALNYLALALRRSGAVDEVMDLAADNLDRAERTGMTEYLGVAHGNLAWVARRDGDLTRVAAHGQQGLDAFRRTAVAWAFEWVARFPLLDGALLQGDTEAAWAQLGAMLDERQARFPRPLEQALLAARRALRAGRHQEAVTTLGQAVRAARAAGFC